MEVFLSVPVGGTYRGSTGRSTPPSVITKGSGASNATRVKSSVPDEPAVGPSTPLFEVEFSISRAMAWCDIFRLTTAGGRSVSRIRLVVVKSGGKLMLQYSSQISHVKRRKSS